jgi:RNA polymerase sigma-70 factor (ECF subfamily)
VLQELLRAEMTKDVQRIVGTLPPEQRIVVVLRYTEGLAYDQIAEILGCSAGTVASRLNRAHKVLERRLSHLRVRGGRGV